jgi:ribosomal protein S6--L-glutamate ligase
MKSQDKFLIGWEEWCGLPDLGIPIIKAKIDTGAKTSAIHAFDIESFIHENELWVKFNLFPVQKTKTIKKTCLAKVIDRRYIMSSNGHKEFRYVIETSLILGQRRWLIEVTLSNRDPLAFRMLLGRKALQRHVIIDPVKSQVTQKLSSLEAKKMYRL